MASLKQIEANRRNSQKSTGPRTPAGIAVSRRNAVKSGLYAQSLLIPGEDPAAFEALTAEYHAEFRPATPRERDLVDTLVFNQWLLQRLRRVEADLWKYRIECDLRVYDKTETNHYHRAIHDHPLSHSYNEIQPQLDRLQLRLNSIDRSTQRALKELRELQSRPEPDPEPVETPATSPQIGFVPSNPPAPSPTPNPQPPIPGRLAGPPAPAAQSAAPCYTSPQGDRHLNQAAAGLPSV